MWNILRSPNKRRAIKQSRSRFIPPSQSECEQSLLLPLGSSNGDGDIDWLISEYHHHVLIKESHFDGIITTASIGYTAAFAIATVISTTDLNLPAEVFWLIPLSFVLLFAIVIQFLYRIVLDSYYLRELEDEIASKSGIDYFHFENTQARALFSLKTGMIPLLFTYVLLFVVSGAVYGGLVVVGYRGLDVEATQNHSGPFLFITLSLGAFMICAVYPILNGFTDHYKVWIRKSADQRPEAISRSKWLLLFWHFLMPRPFDFAAKSISFWVAVVATLFLVNDERIPFDSSGWHLLVLPFLVFLVIDFGAKQSTYIWNEIRDVESDSKHWDKRHRPLVRLGQEMLPFAKIGFVARSLITFIFSFILAYQSGLFWLPFVVFLIYVLQAAYDLKAKPAGGFWRLSVASIGYALRWIPGSLVVLHVLSKWSQRENLQDTHYSLAWSTWTVFTIWGVLFSAVFLAGYWWAESEGFTRRETEREIDLWFIETGEKSVRICTVALFPLTFILVSFKVESSLTERVTLASLAFIIGVSLTWLVDRILGTVCQVWLPAQNDLGISDTATDKDSEADEETLDSKRAGRRLRLQVGIVASFAGMWALVIFTEAPTPSAIWLALASTVLGTLLLFVQYEHNQYEYLMMKRLKKDILGVLIKLDGFLFGKTSQSQTQKNL